MGRGNDNEYQIVLHKGQDQEKSNKPDQQQSSYQAPVRAKFVGLANQGATCYMNSLLQSLFMTIPFRREIYRWIYDPQKHVDQQDCITYQLQVLFGKLQLLQQSERYYIETTDLTKSFGWDIRESFQQHDVQEFCRVLFDAIEESCKGTQQENIINELYQGTFQDYVQCIECQQESSRQDKYLDISLTVRNDFDKIYNSSIQQALENYTMPEKLDKDNMYFCEKCNKKVEAWKGLKFLNFPPILCLQLKRFDLDYQTLMRKKLNDFVSFPQILNMNKYLPESIELRKNESLTVSQSGQMKVENEKEGQEEHISQGQQQEKQNTQEDNDQKEKEENKENPKNSQSTKIPKKTKEELKREREQEIEKSLQEGKFVYELFSIMIHSGSALGGHYYAYIKDLVTDQWNNFNDSQVTQIEESEIEKAFGGIQKGYYWGGANAYLLMYRRVGFELNEVIENNEVPSQVREILEQDRIRMQQEEEQRKERLSNINVRVFYQGEEKLIPVKKTVTILELKQQILQEFEIQEKILEINCRIRGYSSHYEMMQEIYEDENKSLEDLKFYNYRTLTLETKEEGKNFEEYDPQDLHFKIQIWQESEGIQTNQIRWKQYSISINKEKTVEELLQKLETIINIPKDKIQLIWKYNIYGGYNMEKIVNNATDLEKKIQNCRIFEGMTVYVEEIEEGKPLKWKEEFDREANKVILKFNNPKNPKMDNYGFIEYNCEIQAQKQQFLSEIRTLIAQQTQLSENEFLIKRGGKHGTEVKDMQQTIQQTFPNFAQIILYVELGEPTKQGECKSVIWIANIKEDPDVDLPVYVLNELFELNCMENVPITDIKKLIIEEHNQRRENQLEYKEKYPQISFIRLREKIQDRLGKILRNSTTLQKLYSYEKKNIVIEVLQQDEDIQEDTYLCYARHFSPSTWSMSEMHEIFLNKDLTLNELAAVFQQLFNIPEENIQCQRFLAAQSNYCRADLKNETFYKLTNHTLSNSKLCSSPWYLCTDGLVFIVKNNEESFKELSEEEQKKYGKKVGYTNVSSTCYTWVRPKEKSIQITVKKKDQKQSEEGKQDNQTEKVIQEAQSHQEGSQNENKEPQANIQNEGESAQTLNEQEIKKEKEEEKQNI